MTQTFRGIYPALVTPMTPDEQVDLPTLTSLVNNLIEQGVHGLIPLGSTGEYYALSDAEREDVLRTVIEANCPSTRTATKLLAWAMFCSSS